MTRKGHLLGTHRLVPPEETLRRITPLLAGFGITRAADVTGLDDLGIPVFCAIRPRGLILQVSNGKGLRVADAKVSALMESLELHHAEHPPPLREASFAEIARAGPAVPAHQLPWCHGDPRLLGRLRMHWACGELLPARTPIWLPAAAAWRLEPCFFAWSTNGLASGNSVDEATLHALLEVHERDALSRLIDAAGELDFAAMQTLSLAEAPGAALAELRQRIDAAGVRVVLLRVAGDGPLHCLLAVILDPRPFAASSTVSFGAGAHLSPEVAAVRAITEAAQTRLTFIHGSREDLTPRAYDPAGKPRLLEFFSRFAPDTSWDALTDHAGGELEADLATTLAALAALGPIYRIVLSSPELPVAVVKVLVTRARMDFVTAMG